MIYSSLPPSEAAHLDILEKVFQRLSEAGLRLKKEKCSFFTKEVSYLGHRIDQEGLHPLNDKVRAIVEAPTPTNVSELRSYLGLLNYYGKFIPNLSTILAPLNKLQRKGVAFQWGAAQRQAFEKTKVLLQSSRILVHYDPDKEIVLSCDASPYGVGCVLSHIMDDGEERPIAFASRTLSDTETRYATIDKEGLAIVFGVIYKEVSPIPVWTIVMYWPEHPFIIIAR